MDLRPYADDRRGWWVVSDLTPGLDGAGIAVGADHVLGISSASSSLAQLTVRDPVDRALDLGTGCGVQALHLGEHAGHIVATDVNERALAMTRLNAAAQRHRRSTSAPAASTTRWPARRSTWSSPTRRSWSRPAPVSGWSTATPACPATRWSAASSPAPPHLAPGGRARCWPTGCTRAASPGRTASPAGSRAAASTPGWCSARSPTRRSTSSCGSRTPACTAPRRLRRRYDTWLSWFEDQGIEGVGFGWINLRRDDREPVLHLEEWPFEVEQPLGPEVADRGPPYRPARRHRADLPPPGSCAARRTPGDVRRSPARRTRRRSCCASSAGCAAPTRPTPCSPGWSGPATAT